MLKRDLKRKKFIYVTRQHNQWIRNQAAANKESESAVIRRLLDETVAKEPKI